MRFCLRSLGHSGAPDDGPKDPHLHLLTVSLRPALQRARTWAAPPNWMFASWQEELCQTAYSAALTAEREYDQARGVTFELFIHYRALAKLLAFYRAEWLFATKCAETARTPDCNEDPPGSANRISSDLSPDEYLTQREIHNLLCTLSADQRTLIWSLFWERRTESELASKLRISQRAVSKRKHGVLRSLRAQFTSLPAHAPPSK